MQSQRNLICVLLVPTLQLLLARLYLMAPVCPLPGPKAFLPAEDLFGSFPSPPRLSLGLSRKGTDAENIFFPQQFSILRLVPKPRGRGRAGTGRGEVGWNKYLFQELNLGEK